MTKDALDGKINLIVTKSISRFARNTLDTISYVKKLKDAGVEVYFEKENLWTFDSKSELILTIMASIAQEESRSISQNVKWGKRAAFKAGKVSFAYSNFLGYKKVGEDIVIVPEEAEIVRHIYRLFLVEGKSATGIAKYLKANKVDTPSGKNCNWTKNNITSILTNEKYKGDALLQKTFIEDFLEQKVVKNIGQIPQYYVENSHPAIIDKDMWELVQFEIDRREKMGAKFSSTDIFSSKITCGDCGSFYGRKKWHSGTKYERFIYQCNHKFNKESPKCKAPHLYEKDIKLRFIDAYNITMENKEMIISDVEDVIELLTDTTELDKEIETLNDELIVISEMAEKLIKENSKTNMKESDYKEKYQNLYDRHDRVSKEQEKLVTTKKEKSLKKAKMTSFLSTLKNADDKIKYWNKEIWMLMVESATVHRDGSITFKFYNGLKVKVN